MRMWLRGIILCVMVLTTAGISSMPFIEDYFHPKSIIVGFTTESIGNNRGVIDFNIKKGIVATNIKELNQLAGEYKIVDLIQMHPFVKYPEWNDKGIFLQNIYRIVLSSNDEIETARTAIAKSNIVLFAEYETINRTRLIPNDPEYHLQWHHARINSPETWDYVQGSREVIVSITDTGVKWNHPDLADNIWINEAELPGITINWATGQILGGNGMDGDGNGKIDDVIGWDFVDNNNNPYQNYPGNEHGTHVAGCAGAVGDNGIGVTGAAMIVSLMSCKGAPTNSSSNGVSSGYQQIQYSAESGAHIINCSWGGPGTGAYPNSVINYATNLGSLVIAAAGNSNREHTGSYQDYPADATNAFCVAATDQNDLKVGFSDYGAPIDISAPGNNIRSTWGNNGYNTTSGTSMSSPIVAGVAALVKTLNPSFTPSQLKNRIMETAHYIDDVNPDYINKLGTGRVDAFKATMSDKIPLISIYEYSLSEFEGDGDGIANPGEVVNLVFSLYNEIFWLAANDVSAVLSTTSNEVEILVDTIQFPNIDGGSIVFNHSQPYRFRTEENINDLTLPFTLTITANQNSSFPFIKAIDFEVELSMQQAGWPFELNGTSTSSALIFDLNKDGNNEIIFGDAQGNLHAVRANKTYLPGFPVYLGSNISSAVAIADITNDNNPEIVANTQTGTIYAVKNDGSILIQYNAGGQLRSNPMIVDVNGDGNYELVAITYNNPKVIILNSDGSDFTGFPVSISAGLISSPSSADLNGDGNKEIIFVTTGGELAALSIVTGSNIAGFPKALGGSSWNGPIVADITGNNQPDIALATVQGRLYAFDKQGTELINRNIGNPIRTSIVVYDIDNDGSSELIFGDTNGQLYITDNTGVNISGFPVNIGSSIESTPILADMNLDGNLDIIFGDGNGYLNSINISGQQTPNFPIFLGTALNSSPAIGYINNNLKPGILIPNSYGYNFVDYKRQIGTIGWAFFKGNIRRTGNSFDMTGTDDFIYHTPIQTELFANYPNPFNPETTISFTLATEENVKLSIYNIRGQKIIELADTQLSAGKHRYIWNGHDDRQRKAASGIYFYRLVTDSYQASRRMILLK